MKKITACFLTALLLFSLACSPALGKPGNGKSSLSPGKAGANSASSQADKNAFSEVIKNRTEQTTRLEEKLQSKSSTPAVKAKNQVRIRQEIKEMLLSQNREQANQALPEFSDINNHWGARSIKRLAALGIINGYPDGSFKPEGEITQAEALSLIMRVADSEADESKIDENTSEAETLKSVPDWAKKAVRTAARNRIINIARFHSKMQATRLQTAVWIAKALGIEPADTTNIPFKDGILISKEDLGYIIALYNMGIIKGTPDGKFNPNSHITRAEIAAIIERLLQKSSADEGSENSGITEENSSSSLNQTSETTGTENTSEPALENAESTENQFS